MPHLRIEYTGRLEPQLEMAALCQALAGTMAKLQDADGKPVFPLNGTRVLAYPAPHHAVAGGQEGHGFIYLNLRITPGRSAETLNMVGDALLATVRTHTHRLAIVSPVGITLHIDEGAPVYEGKHRLPS
jgi:5-carboxymethyl-2-hydroxymuconate isomerase